MGQEEMMVIKVHWVLKVLKDPLVHKEELDCLVLLVIKEITGQLVFKELMVLMDKMERKETWAVR